MERGRNNVRVMGVPEGGILFRNGVDLESELRGEGWDDQTIWYEYLTDEGGEREVKRARLGDVKVKVWELVHKYVKVHQPYYYRQFQGDLWDLGQDIFESFMKAKSKARLVKDLTGKVMKDEEGNVMRVRGREQSLLDKYNPQVTSIEYLVKGCVIRKLIDYSRGDKVSFVRYQSLLEEFGDRVLVTFRLDVKGGGEGYPEGFEWLASNLEDPTVLEWWVKKFEGLTEVKRRKVFREYEAKRDELPEGSRVFFEELFRLCGGEGLTEKVIRKGVSQKRVTRKRKVRVVPEEQRGFKVKGRGCYPEGEEDERFVFHKFKMGSGCSKGEGVAEGSLWEGAMVGEGSRSLWGELFDQGRVSRCVARRGEGYPEGVAGFLEKFEGLLPWMFVEGWFTQGDRIKLSLMWMSPSKRRKVLEDFKKRKSKQN